MFSDLARQFNAPLNALFTLEQTYRRRGIPFVDLISGNVNAGGIRFPEATLQDILQKAARTAATYRPDPLGQANARKAIRRYYSKEGLSIPEERILLTPGTSVSYWYLFKILAQAGDEILCPTPSYPLFDMIAALSGVKLIPYRLLQRGRWEIDLSDLAARVRSRTRAIVVISPHNPTGAVASAAELQGVGRVAKRHHLPVIFDEVFCPFRFSGVPFARPSPREYPLVFLLNGFSKMFALPGMKIGWIAIQGRGPLVQQALRSLEMISDTLLPVNEIAQAAVPDIFKHREDFLKTYQGVLHQRLKLALSLFAKTPAVTTSQPEGGFHLILRHPGERSDERVTLDLLRKERLLLHPGYYYGLDPGHLVLTFVQRPAVLKKSFRKIVQYFQ